MHFRWWSLQPLSCICASPESLNRLHSCVSGEDKQASLIDTTDAPSFSKTLKDSQSFRQGSCKLKDSLLPSLYYNTTCFFKSKTDTGSSPTLLQPQGRQLEKGSHQWDLFLITLYRIRLKTNKLWKALTILQESIRTQIFPALLTQVPPMTFM